MKICIFTETYYPVVGGGETQTRALAEGLVARGIDVEIITRRSDPTLPKVETQAHMTIRRLAPIGTQHYRKWGLLASSLPALLGLQYDLLYVSGFRIIGVVAVFVSRILGRPCILKADSMGEMSGDFFVAGLRKLGINPNFILFHIFLAARNRVFKQADCFVAISTAIQDELQAHGIQSESIQAIPNSVDTRLFSPVDTIEKQHLRRSLHLVPEAMVVVYTGRLVSYKGLPLLLRVWQHIAKAHPTAVLVLVGSGGMDIHNCEAELKDYVQANYLPVFFAGAVTNVVDYLRAADIFVFPSENEAFGISVIEAMACGLPVITTDAGGLRDIIQHQQNGLVVSAGEAEPLFHALNTCLHNAALRSSLGRSARQTAEARYATDAVIERHIMLFQHLLENKRK